MKDLKGILYYLFKKHELIDCLIGHLIEWNVHNALYSHRFKCYFFVLFLTDFFPKTTIIRHVNTSDSSHFFLVDIKQVHVFSDIIDWCMHVDCHSSQERRTALQIQR